MKLPILVLLAVAAVCRAQTGGTVTQTTLTTVTATAGTVTTTEVVCLFSNPARPTVHTVCSQNGATVLTMDSTPAVGATNGAVGSIELNSNAVTWIVQQPTAGVVTWQIAANGIMVSGTF